MNIGSSCFKLQKKMQLIFLRHGVYIIWKETKCGMAVHAGWQWRGLYLISCGEAAV